MAVEKQQTSSEDSKMIMFHKAGAALLAVVAFTVGADAMAHCDVQQQKAWRFTPSLYTTLTCWSHNRWINLADFQLQTNGGSWPNARVNLTGGTYSQILGLTQSGAYVAGCSADDLTANNIPVYLNWNNQNAACQQAYLALLAAGSHRPH
jgi:hypothetical protein